MTLANSETISKLLLFILKVQFFYQQNLILFYILKNDHYVLDQLLPWECSSEITV